MIKTSDRYKNKILNAKTNNGVTMNNNVEKFIDEQSFENVVMNNTKKKVTLKRKPRVHISTRNGFNELLEELNIIEHIRKSEFTHPPINENNIVEWKEDIDKITNFFKENDVTIPTNIKGLVQNKARLSTYKSDTFVELGVEYIDSKTISEKYDEQRIRNESVEKIMDNYRYTYLRATNLADGNQFPYGVRTDLDVTTLCQYDRSNLTEFEIVNFISDIKDSNLLNITDDGIATIENDVVSDKLGKSELQMVLGEIKESYPQSYPKTLDSTLDKIKNDPASSKYTIRDILDNESIEDLLYKFNNTHILIGNHDVISKELECLNNKNNVWQNINFAYQKIKQTKNVSFVNEAKKVLKKTDCENILKYFSTLIDKAPEYCLVPSMVENIFTKQDFKSSNQDRYSNYESMCKLIEGKDGGVTYMQKHYEDTLSDSELPKFRYKFIDTFYSQDALDIWKSYCLKLKRLKTILSNLNKSKKTRTDEVLQIATTKIDRLINSNFSYPAYVKLISLYGGDGKTIKNDDSNIIKAIGLFLNRFFGDDIFTVNFKSNKYTIKDTEFLKLLTHTDQDGYSQSHEGRAKYFVSDKLQKFTEDYYDWEDYQGTNEERVDKHIIELKEITRLTKFGWWEDTVSGDVTYCGYDGDTKDNVSWEHIENNKQTYGAIRANETNSSDGNKTKAFSKTSEYYEYILKSQSSPKVKIKYTDRELMMIELQLESIIEYYREQEK